MFLSNEYNEIVGLVDVNLKRALELAREKGSGSWLTSMPLKFHGYSLNKQEFKDSVCLRYGWNIPNTPAFCSCGSRNSVNHILTCKSGGYTIMRHNALRDTEAELLKEVCKDVMIEPELLPLEVEELGTQGNVAERARLDISARGVWSPFEKTFFDVRVMHPNSSSYVTKTPHQLYSQHEKEKKRMYNDRVLQVEKGSFTPLVFSTTGGMASEATRFHKRLAELISEKKGESYSDVINYIRTRLRFALLRSVLIAVRGIRGKRNTTQNSYPISSVSFNLIPEFQQYECY